MQERTIFNVALLLDRAREKRRLTSISHAAAVREALADFAARHADVYVWLAMPDHIHVLFSAHRTVKNLDHFIGRIKRRINDALTRRGMQKLHWRDGVVNHPVDWQSAARIREYILHNPVRGLLVAHHEQWPHSGTPADLP